MSINPANLNVQAPTQERTTPKRVKRSRLCQTVNSSANQSFENWFGAKRVTKKARYLPQKASPKIISSEPRIWCIDSFLTDSQAAKVLECVKKLKFVPSRVSDGNKEEIMEYKTSKSAAFTFQNGNLSVLTLLYKKIQQLMPDVALETPLQVVKYQPGEICALHHDSTALDTSGRRPKIVSTDEKVVRVMTGFLYLNSLEDGTTTFPNLKLSVTPKAGRLLLFPDVTDIKKLKLDERTIHSADPSKEVKYGINIWFLNKPRNI